VRDEIWPRDGAGTPQGRYGGALAVGQSVATLVERVP
jgi:hypothetical protein